MLQNNVISALLEDDGVCTRSTKDVWKIYNNLKGKLLIIVLVSTNTSLRESVKFSFIEMLNNINMSNYRTQISLQWIIWHLMD